MLRRLFPAMTMAFLSGGLFLPSVCAGGSNHDAATAGNPGGPRTQSEDLHPFTHLVYLPADTDPGTIRFEKGKLVKTATRMEYTAGSCDEAGVAEPGGSIGCGSARTAGAVPAYEATYSFSAPPLASDEYGGRYFTFQVRFRMDELPADMQKALSSGKLSRADLAAYFAVTTSRGAVSAMAIDARGSQFCAGSFVDGAWTADRGCRDEIRYRTVTMPSGYLTVKVKPVVARAQGVATASAR